MDRLAIRNIPTGRRELCLAVVAAGLGRPDLQLHLAPFAVGSNPVRLEQAVVRAVQLTAEDPSGLDSGSRLTDNFDAAHQRKGIDTISRRIGLSPARSDLNRFPRCVRHVSQPNPIGGVHTEARHRARRLHGSTGSVPQPCASRPCGRKFPTTHAPARPFSDTRLAGEARIQPNKSMSLPSRNRPVSADPNSDSLRMPFARQNSAIRAGSACIVVELCRMGCSGVRASLQFIRAWLRSEARIIYFAAPISSISRSIMTSSLTATPPDSMIGLYRMPKSLRLSFEDALTPIFSRP